MVVRTTCLCACVAKGHLNKEGLCYTPKKGKVAFAPHKTSFVKNNGRYCTSCKQVGRTRNHMPMNPQLSLIPVIFLQWVPMV
jgi:hypothetical protein